MCNIITDFIVIKCLDNDVKGVCSLGLPRVSRDAPRSHIPIKEDERPSHRASAALQCRWRPGLHFFPSNASELRADQLVNHSVFYVLDGYSGLPGWSSKLLSILLNVFARKLKTIFGRCFPFPIKNITIWQQWWDLWLVCMLKGVSWLHREVWQLS